MLLFFNVFFLWRRDLYEMAPNKCSMYICTGCSKSHAPSLTRYILRYENSTTIKEVYLDRVTLHNFCDIKHDPIDDFFNEIP